MSESIVTRRPNVPHKAVIWIEAQVHELTQHGECRGDPTYKIEKFPVAIDGADKNICCRKLNEALEEFKRLCEQK